MAKRKTFIDRCLVGSVSDPDKEVDDAICEWHRSTTGTTLNEWLGMNEEEYKLFVEKPENLLAIIEARRFLA